MIWASVRENLKRQYFTMVVSRGSPEVGFRITLLRWYTGVYRRPVVSRHWPEWYAEDMAHE